MASEKSSSTVVKGRNALKKGPWTASEDMLLVEYVKKHGEGNWNAVQRNSGLMRCGKSCRLRWANHLRPNLKKGAFSSEEEKLIIDLHAKLGNKWARMAAQLPGRTDNEIKNYWNTRLKRRQRAGLPIYPQEGHQGQQTHQLFSSLQPSISSMLASSHLPNPNPNPNSNPFSFFGSFTSPATLIPPQHQASSPLKLFNDNNSSLSLTLNPVSFFSNSLPVPSLVQYNSLDFGVNSELPSIQSAASSSEFVMDASSNNAGEDHEVDRSNKSGLLEDLLGESQAFTGHEIAKDSFIAPTENQPEESPFGFGHVDETSENHLEGENQMGFGEVTDSGDEDLLNLLDNFPLAVPIPDWSEENSYGSPNLTRGTSGTVESRQEDSQYNVVATPSGSENQDWNFGVCLWNNMPNIH